MSAFEQKLSDNLATEEDRTSDGSDEDDTCCSLCSTNSTSSSSRSSDGEGDLCPGPRDPEEGDSPCSADTEPTSGSQSRGHTAAGQGQGLPPPICSVHWQDSWTVRPEGGCFRKPGSDVILQAPPEAVKKDGGVVVHTAICADVERIRRVLNLSDDEEIVTPLAEYWAGQDFRFQRPVSIILPHFLPPDYEPDFVHVYHVTRTHDGRVTFLRINQVPETNTVPEDGVVTSNDTYRRENIQFRESYITIFTGHFSGYVCTYCDKEVKRNGRPRPQLYVMGSGSLTTTPDSLFYLDVSAHVWDKRITVADCRQEYGIEEGRFRLVELLDTLCNSQLQLTMRIGAAHSTFTHRLDQDGNRLLPVDLPFDLPRFLGCKKCLKKGKLQPKCHQWALQSGEDCRPLPSVEVALDVSHTTHDTQKSQNTSLHLPVLQIEATQNEGGGQGGEQWRHLLSALSTAQLEVVAEDLDFIRLEKVRLKYRHKSKEDYRKQVIEMCCLQDSHTVIATIASLMPTTGVDGDPTPAAHSDQRPMAGPSLGYSSAGLKGQTMDFVDQSGRYSNFCVKNGDTDSSGDTDESSSTSSRSDCVRNLNTSLSPDDTVQPNPHRVSTDLPKPISLAGPPSTLGVLAGDKDIPINLITAAGVQTSSSAETEGCCADAGASSTHVLKYEAQLKKDTDGKVSGTVAYCSRFEGVDPSQLTALPGLHLSIESSVSSMVDDDKNTFKYIDRDIVLMVAKQLLVHGDLTFFLKLGLSIGQYEVLSKKYGSDPESLTMQCLITWCRCKGEEANVDKLIQTLESIDRADIVEAVKDAVKEKKNKSQPDDVTRPDYVSA